MCGPFWHFESSHVLFYILSCLPYLAMVLRLSELYCSLRKSAHGRSTLQVCQTEWGGHSFECSALNLERAPSYSELMPSKQIIVQTVIYTMDLSAPSNKRFWKC